SAGKVLDQRRFPCGRRAQYQDILHEKPSERPGDIIPVQYRLFPDACSADPEYLTVYHCDTRIDSAPIFIKEITEWIDILFLTYIKGHITHFEVQTIENLINLLCKDLQPWFPAVGVSRDICFIQLDDRHVFIVPQQLPHRLYPVIQRHSVCISAVSFISADDDERMPVFTFCTHNLFKMPDMTRSECSKIYTKVSHISISNRLIC